MTEGKDFAYPQLSRDKARAQIAENSKLNFEQLGSQVPSFLERKDFEFRPLATKQVSSIELLEVRNKIMDLWKRVESGEDRLFNVDKRVLFDRRLTESILHLLPMSPHEASSEGVWSYLTLRLLPDIGSWRFPNESNNMSFERYLGMPRNTFKRLWWRSYMLGPQIAGQLGENDHVQMFERGMTIGSNRQIVATMAGYVIDNVNQLKSDKIGTSQVIIEAAKQIKRQLAVVTFEAMSIQDRNDFVLNAMNHARESLILSKIEH